MSQRPTCALCLRPVPLGPVFLYVHHGVQGAAMCPDCWERYSEARGFTRLKARCLLALNARRLRRR